MTTPAPAQGHLPAWPTKCAYVITEPPWECQEPLARVMLLRGHPSGYCEAHAANQERFHQSTKSWREAYAEGLVRWQSA